MSKKLYTGFSFFEFITMLLLRLVCTVGLVYSLAHYDENPVVIIIVSLLCLLFILILGDDQIIIYEDKIVQTTNSFAGDEETPVNLLAVMLDTVLVRDRPYAIELINKNIRGINVHQFPTFADKALKLGDTSFISSLFDRLKTEDNPHIYLKATEVLIALKDKEINKRIVEVARTNPALRKDWGGKEFTKLLKDNGIR